MPKSFDQPRDSYAAVPTTAWDLIRDASASTAEQRKEILGKLIARYWKPIYAYFRSQGKSQHDADDLTQGFICQLIDDDKLRHINESKGRFRDWLLVCLRNYMYGQARRARASKRHPTGGLLSFDDLVRDSGKPFEPPLDSEPDEAFDDALRRDLLDRALKTVADDCQRASQELDYQLFCAYYCNDVSKTTWPQVAQQFGVERWKDAARKADGVRAKLRRAIRQEIAVDAKSAEEIDDELQRLINS